MKTISSFLPLLLIALSISFQAYGQNEGRFQQEATLIYDAEKTETVWIGDANEATILYYVREQAVNPERMPINKLQSIWLIEPKAYAEAIDLYQGRDFEAAREKFAEVRETYKPLITLPDNHSSLAAFYEMECLRKLGKYEEITKKLDKFLPDDRKSLTRPHQLRQIELYTMWEAVHLKEWPRLERIARERVAQKAPKHQRVQAAYALGLALDNQQRPLEALDAYHTAITANTGASKNIASKAALKALAIYLNDKLVKDAIEEGGETEDNRGTARVARLKEAAATAALYQISFPQQAPLPAQFETFLKYLPKQDS